MPLGAARLNTLSRVQAVAAATTRTTGFVNITSFNQVQLSIDQYKFRTGTRGGSIKFDGTGDYALSDDPILPATDDFTAECFVYFTDTSADKAIFSQHGDTGAGLGGSRFFIAVQANNKVDVYLRNSANSDWSFRIFGATTISTNTWTHVAVVRNSNTFTLYINGTNDGSTSSSDPILQSDFAIGALSNSGAYDLLGYIDEVRISDTARYTGNFTAPTSAFEPDNNTLLLLHGDGPYGQNGNFHIIDHIADGVRPLDVHIQTAYTQGSGSAPSISTAQAKFGSSSFRMNDNNGHCEFATPEWGDGLTLEFWFKPDSISAGIQQMAGAWGGNAHGGFNHVIGLSGAQVRCSVFGGSTFRLNNVLIGTISNTNWHHVAITWDGSTYRTFLDGVMGPTSSSSEAPGYDKHQVTWVGTVGGITDVYAGYIDEFRQSNIARYTSNFTPSSFAFTEDANTQVLLHFDGTNGDTTTVDGYGSRTSSAISVSLTDNAHISTDQAKFGSTSVELDGTNDAVDPDHANLNIGSGDFTIEFFYYPTDLSTVHGRYFFDTGSGVSGRLNGYFNSSSQFVIRNGNTELLKASHGMSTGQWYHLAIVRQSGTLRFFRDGTSLASVSNSTSFSNNDYRIGVYLGGGGFGIVGYVDEFRHSDVARYSGSSFTVPTSAFTKDGATKLLLHFDGSNGDTTTSDDA